MTSFHVFWIVAVLLDVTSGLMGSHGSVQEAASSGLKNFRNNSGPSSVHSRDGDSHQFSGFEYVYLASGDPLGELMHNSFSLLRSRQHVVDNFVSVVGSLDALQLLLAVRPGSITFFDMNPSAVKFAKMKVELILASSSPQEYITRLFARNVTLFESRHSHRLDKENQRSFLAMPPDDSIRQETKRMLTARSRKVYEMVLQPFHDTGFWAQGWRTTRNMYPCEVRQKLRCCTNSGLGAGPQQPHDWFFSFRYGEGFLTNDDSFHHVKDILQHVPINWVVGVDFPNAEPFHSLGCTKPECRTLIFVMDMFSSNFASTWRRSKIDKWYRTVGRGALMLMQTITMRRESLFQEYNGSWTSLSDWDSSSLMPDLICEGPKSSNACCTAPLHVADTLKAKSTPADMILRFASGEAMNADTSQIKNNQRVPASVDKCQWLHTQKH